MPDVQFVRTCGVSVFLQYFIAPWTEVVVSAMLCDCSLCTYLCCVFVNCLLNVFAICFVVAVFV